MSFVDVPSCSEASWVVALAAWKADTDTIILQQLEKVNFAEQHRDMTKRQTKPTHKQMGFKT